MKEKKTTPLQKKLGYQFNDQLLLRQALTHRSAGLKHNERLEFLGDAVLNLVIADLLYQQFSSAQEGELTRRRASLVNRNTLALVAQELSLGEYLTLGIGERRSGGFRRESILADALEALIGAIYLDTGFAACYQCIKAWFNQRMAYLQPEQQKDPKTRLQEWLQADQKPLPKYQITGVEGEPHLQFFTVSCTIDALNLVVEGKGSSRRLAEQEAAQKALEQINE